MSGYQPHFDTDLERGRVGENLLNTFLADLAGKKFEVKTDYRAWETGNFYIETWQYRQPDAIDKKPSGINITEAGILVLCWTEQKWICNDTD